CCRDRRAYGEDHSILSKKSFLLWQRSLIPSFPKETRTDPPTGSRVPVGSVRNVSPARPVRTATGGNAGMRVIRGRAPAGRAVAAQAEMAPADRLVGMASSKVRLRR